VQVSITYESLDDATKTQTVRLAVDLAGGEDKADGTADETWSKTLTQPTGENPVRVPAGVWLTAPMVKHGNESVNVTAESYQGNDSLDSALTQGGANR